MPRVASSQSPGAARATGGAGCPRSKRTHEAGLQPWHGAAWRLSSADGCLSSADGCLSRADAAWPGQIKGVHVRNPVGVSRAESFIWQLPVCWLARAPSLTAHACPQACALVADPAQQRRYGRGLGVQHDAALDLVVARHGLQDADGRRHLMRLALGQHLHAALCVAGSRKGGEGGRGHNGRPSAHLERACGCGWARVRARAHGDRATAGGMAHGSAGGMKPCLLAGRRPPQC